MSFVSNTNSEAEEEGARVRKALRSVIIKASSKNCCARNAVIWRRVTLAKYD